MLSLLSLSYYSSESYESESQLAAIINAPSKHMLLM